MASVVKKSRSARTPREMSCENCRVAKLKCEKIQGVCKRCIKKVLVCGGPVPTRQKLEKKTKRQQESGSRSSNIPFRHETPHTPYIRAPPNPALYASASGLQHDRIDTDGIRHAPGPYYPHNALSPSISHTRRPPTFNGSMFEGVAPNSYASGAHRLERPPNSAYPHEGRVPSSTTLNERLGYSHDHQQHLHHASQFSFRGSSSQAPRAHIDPFADAHPPVLDPVPTAAHFQERFVFSSSIPSSAQYQTGYIQFQPRSYHEHLSANELSYDTRFNESTHRLGTGMP